MAIRPTFFNEIPCLGSRSMK